MNKHHHGCVAKLWVCFFIDQTAYNVISKWI